MRLRDLYKEFIRLHMAKGEKFVRTLIPKTGIYGEDKENAKKYDWYTDGYVIWSVPKKDNPFKTENLPGGEFEIPNAWLDKDYSTEVVSKIADPDINSPIIKLVDKEEDFMYLDSKRLKFFDKDAEFRIIKEKTSNSGMYTKCQVLENGEIRGMAMGVNLSEEIRF